MERRRSEGDKGDEGKGGRGSIGAFSEGGEGLSSGSECYWGECENSEGGPPSLSGPPQDKFDPGDSPSPQSLNGPMGPCTAPPQGFRWVEVGVQVWRLGYFERVGQVEGGDCVGGGDGRWKPQHLPRGFAPRGRGQGRRRRGGRQEGGREGKGTRRGWKIGEGGERIVKGFNFEGVSIVRSAR